MSRYYVYYPRNFANEYEIYSACTSAGREKAEAFVKAYSNDINKDFHRITRDQARRMAGRYGFVSLDDGLVYNFSGDCLTKLRDFCACGRDVCPI